MLEKQYNSLAWLNSWFLILVPAAYINIKLNILLQDRRKSLTHKFGLLKCCSTL